MSIITTVSPSSEPEIPARCPGFSPSPPRFRGLRSPSHVHLGYAEVHEHAVNCVEVGSRTHFLGKIALKLFVKRKVFPSTHRTPRATVPAAEIQGSKAADYDSLRAAKIKAAKIKTQRSEYKMSFETVSYFASEADEARHRVTRRRALGNRAGNWVQLELRDNRTTLPSGNKLPHKNVLPIT